MFACVKQRVTTPLEAFEPLTLFTVSTYPICSMSYLPTSGPNIHGHVGKFSIHGAFRYQTFYPSIVLSRGFKVFLCRWDTTCAERF